MGIKFKSLLTIVLGATLLAACNVVVYNDPYDRAWYDVYGNQCNSYGYPTPGCNFYADGSKITASNDPYSYNETLYWDYWSYTDSYGYYRHYTGYAWQSSDGIIYDDYGNALNEMDQSAGETPDVLAQAAQKEVKVATQVGQEFAQKYALSENTGITIAKTLQAWAVLGRDRSRTPDDVKAFAKRLYGIDANKAVDAMNASIQGNQKGLLDLNADVAAHWGTTPETSSRILKSWYSDSLSTVGVSQ